MPRIRLIADDFNGFINIEDFEKIPQAPKNEKTDYYKNTKTGFSFLHDFPQNIPLSESFDSVKQKYLRRIDRFYQNIRAGANVLLVWFSLDEQTKNEDIIEASTCLNEKFHKNIDFLIIEHDESLLNQNIKFSLLTPNIFKYQLYAKNLLEEHDFTKGNVKKCTAIFRQYSLTLSFSQKAKYFLLKALCNCIPFKKIRKRTRKKLLHHD